MQRAALFLARFCSSAWIGAATLFVVVGIIEVTQGDFDATIKDTLVSLRFPSFYRFGVVLISLAWLGTCLADLHPQLPRRRRAFAILSLIAVLALLVIDYQWIYSQLSSMVNPPGLAKPAAFAAYHQASKYINLTGLVFGMIAVVVLQLASRN